MTGFPSFDDFFRALWPASSGQATEPFPWQRRLARQALDGQWPHTISLPTGSGKTSVIDIWAWALAAAAHGAGAAQPRRLFFVIDRRIVVDSVFDRAVRIADALERGDSRPMQAVADALLALGGSSPLRAARLRGGLEIDPDWATDPAQPLACATTVDQLGSRLLFRGYGLSRGAKNPLPIHAALVGNDALIVLDEAHLSAPFDETLETVGVLRAQAEHRVPLPWACLRMSATPRPSDADTPFTLEPADEKDRRLARRLTAKKPARLVEVSSKPQAHDAIAAAAVSEVHSLLADESLRAIGVVANRVARARAVAEALRAGHPEIDVILLIGPSRPGDRDRAVAAIWPRIGSGRSRDRSLDRVIIVATQTIEVGIDIDLDALVTECAPIDSLRQRFGRLDRLGEMGGRGAGVILYRAQAEPDAVYGLAVQATWEWLSTLADDGLIDVGPLSLVGSPPETLAPVSHAPLLFPAYVDRFAQTSPMPDPDPAVSVFLHGFDTQPADVEIVWRTDIDPADPDSWRDIVALVPPSGREVVRVSFLAARRWLAQLPPVDVSDLEGTPLGAIEVDDSPGRLALRWRGGHSDETEAIAAADLRPGDIVVVPAIYGGCDREGWAPRSSDPVFDIVELSAEPADPVLRLHPAVLRQHGLDPGLAQDLFIPDEDDPSLDVPDAPAIDRALSAIAEADTDLAALAEALRGAAVLPYPDLRGVVICQRDEPAFVGDDDSHLVGGEVTLREHQVGVEAEATRIAAALGFGHEIASSIRLAAQMHDEGKRDPRFQRVLAGGSPAVPPEPLAKSRVRVRDARAFRRAWHEAGLPAGFRHEAVSAALLESVAPPADSELVHHLVVSHHGCARPFLRPVRDPTPWVDIATLERPDGEIPERFWRLVRKYGWWGLALLESVLRLADHRQSARERV